MKASTNEAAELIFRADLDRVQRRVDRLFAVLMLGQWVFAVGLALWLSPHAWQGKVKSVHIHVYAAIVLGGLLSGPAIALALLRPGRASTRQLIAMTQMLWSALLIHLTGGRIETHFHVFGSLAFLAFYRDYRVLPTATLVVAADHLFRGLLWPESVYGVQSPEWWRFLEHSWWVVFENVFLAVSCVYGIREMREIASRRAANEELSATLEGRVEERTLALSEANGKLAESFDELRRTQARLMEASRRTGMADVATAVLHDVGNVLNSVNVSAGMLADGVRRSKAAGVEKLSGLLRVNAADLSGFFSRDPRARRIPDYVAKLAEDLSTEKSAMLRELESLQRNVDHVKVIVSRQQSHAKASGSALEKLSLQELLDDALDTSQVSYERHAIEVVRDYQQVPQTLADRHKIFQVVMNLLSNARHAVKEAEGPRRLTIRLRMAGERLQIQVADTGVGIAAGNLARIFNHGFTTKKDGHGFGLHSSACAAAEMGGTLTCESEGEGRGAVFTLEIPRAQAPARAA